MNNISKKSCFPSTRKVLDFDLNGQHMRKTEVPERQVRKTCFSTEGRKQWFSFACGVGFFADIEHCPHIF